MYHHVAHTHGRAFCICSWPEAAELWTRIGTIPGIVAAVLMPDHLHVVHPDDVRIRLASVLSGYTRWRHHRRGTGGSAFLPLPPPRFLPDRVKQRIDVRYVHLNPCRAGLVADPLAWPFSTHRDAVGLTAFPIATRRPDPARFHHYVSGDPTVDVAGTDLPSGSTGQFTPAEVLDAVSACTRVPYLDVHAHPRARRLYLQAALSLCAVSHAEIGALVGVERVTVRRQIGPQSPLVKVVSRIIGDPRFAPLDYANLAADPLWRAYRDRPTAGRMP